MGEWPLYPTLSKWKVRRLESTTYHYSKRLTERLRGHVVEEIRFVPHLCPADLLLICFLYRFRMSMTTLNIKIEFGGGLELLFSNQRSHRISLPAHRLAVASSTSPGDSGDSDTEAQPANMDFLIQWLKENLLKERVELFVENDTVCVGLPDKSPNFRVSLTCWMLRRPGILVLINDTDWELEGEGQYELKEGDEVVFISTLHGG